jgi:hypothetical protein
MLGNGSGTGLRVVEPTMLKIPPMPDLPPPAERPPWVGKLLAVIVALRELVWHLRRVVAALRDEVAELKKQKKRPVVRPSKLTEGEKKKKGRGPRKKGHDPPRPPDCTMVVKAEQVPEGSRFKGYGNFTVQDLVIRTETTLYRVQRWLTPEGKMVSGVLPIPLPEEGPGHHFGATIRCFILYQYYHALVTEPLILEQLREWGVTISSGELHGLITRGKEQFHREKDAILEVGLRVSGHVHVDDTGARLQGHNGVTTHIGNEWFAWFQTTVSKSRINFLGLLRAGRTDYVLSGEALEYMAARKLPQELLAKLAAAAERGFADKAQWQTALAELGITDKRHVQITTEGALLGSVLKHGINPHLAIVSDDAGQFNVLLHALCWIHAERVLARLIGFNSAQREDLEKTRTAVWELYRDLKAYKVAPTPEARRALDARFDQLCTRRTCFVALNQALKRMHRNKRELLMVLERPDLPLHNNLSEGDIREYVKRRKISGGTRSEDGRRARDTFASLKKTCRKLGISFWSYLNDRIQGDHVIPQLATLIEAHAQPP